MRAPWTEAAEMAGAVAAVARRIVLFATALTAATAAACASPPLDVEDFERDTGIAAPTQPEPAEVRRDRVPERRTTGGAGRSPDGDGRLGDRVPDATSLGFGDGASIVASALSGRGERTLVQVNLYDGYGVVTSRGAGGGVEWTVVRGDGPEEPRALPPETDHEGEAGRFGPDDVEWAIIPGLVEATPGALGVDGRVSHVIVERNLPFSPDVVIRVYVSGAGGRGGRIDHFADGRPMRVFRDS